MKTVLAVLLLCVFGCKEPPCPLCNDKQAIVTGASMSDLFPGKVACYHVTKCPRCIGNPKYREEDVAPVGKEPPGDWGQGYWRVMKTASIVED